MKENPTKQFYTNICNENKELNNIFRLDEIKYLDELYEYIKSTYDQHYGSNKIQTTEFIIDSQNGQGFCVGNIIKYAQRYGKKDGYNKKDIMKILHYGILLLHNHEKLQEKK